MNATAQSLNTNKFYYFVSLRTQMALRNFFPELYINAFFYQMFPSFLA